MPTQFHARTSFAALAATTLIACSSSPREPHVAAQPSASEPASAPSHDELITRGRQLVTMGSCNDCHTPMSFDPKLGMPVPDMTRMLSGHPVGAPEPAAQPGAGDQAVIGATFTSFRLPFGVVYAANLTPHAETGLGRWTADDFVQTMRTGHERGTGRALLPPMPWQNLAQQSDQDLHAIFAYLQSIPAIDNAVKPAAVPAEVVASIAQSYKTLLEQQAAVARP